MRLTLVRHGHSKHGVEQYIAGNIGCKGLTERGIQQARQLAQRLKSEPVRCDVLLSTSVKRAHETATIIGAQINQPVQIEDDLRELLPGDADGLSWEQYRQQYGEFDFATHPDRLFAPNGESWNQFVDRVKTILNTLNQTYGDQDVIAVTHSGFIVVAFLVLFEAPFFNRRAVIHPDYTSITEWQISADTWQLVRFNDTHHLSSRF
jgi:broad specificity phosphatase PhoE